jgi:glycosyltransferase 2 family protein
MAAAAPRTVPPADASDRRKPGAKPVVLLVAACLAAVLLYFSLRGIEWKQVARIIRGASVAPLLLAMAISSFTIFLRACRWRILLNAEGAVSVSTAFWATASGYFGNSFLPARAGELVRTVMISSRSTLENPYVLATALSERAADAVTLVGISAIVLLLVPAETGWLAASARPLAAIAVVGLASIALLPRLAPVVGKIIQWAPLPRAIRPKLSSAIAHSLRGVGAFHHRRRLFGFVTLTVLIWSLDAVGTVVTGSALGLRIPIVVAFLLLAALGLGSALPSTPGYVGIYQFVAVTVLTPFGFSRNDAIAYILVAQVLMFVVVGFWGSIGLLRYRRAERLK